MGKDKKPGPATMETMDKCYQQVLSQTPKWSLGTKPEMVIGGDVPSWKKSIPGPKYDYDPDKFKKRQPVYTMREKPKMIIGAGVPSWTKSIPGPKYSYDPDAFKKRQPVYSMVGGRDPPKGLSRSSSAPPGPPDTAALDAGDRMQKRSSPSWSLGFKPKMIIGDSVPSWTKSIPGPKYSYDPDQFKERQPTYTIGTKLPTEGDLMKTRSPGPTHYGGAAVDAKLMSHVDSTKKKTFSCSFGVGPRWEGQTYEMCVSGALTRYDQRKV